MEALGSWEDYSWQFCWYDSGKGEKMGVLKHSGREEQAFLTSLAGLILVLFWMVPYIYELFETIKNLFAL